MNHNSNTSYEVSYETRFSNALKALHAKTFNNDGTMRAEFCEYVVCPICSAHKATLYCEKDNFMHHRCSSCSMVYVNPRLNDSATLQFYNSDANEVYNEQKFNFSPEGQSIDDVINRENIRLICENLNSINEVDLPLKNKKVLEVGCAKGYFLKVAKSFGAEIFGIELNERNSEFARHSLGHNIYNKNLFELNLPEDHFDIIYMRDVIEHIHNPIPFLNELYRLLKPGGIVFIETHNIDSWIHKIVGGKHTCLFGFEHPVHWSPKTLTYALEKTGFLVSRVYFESLDLNFLTILNYFRVSTWTTISPWKAKTVKNLFFLILSMPFRVRLINRLTASILERIANYAKAGSTMKLVAHKK